MVIRFLVQENLQLLDPRLMKLNPLRFCQDAASLLLESFLRVQKIELAA